MASPNSNGMYHRASKIVPGWKKLSVERQASCFKWLIASDTRWDDKYKVTVSSSKFNTEFIFEGAEDAEACKKWWAQFGNSLNVSVINLE